MTEKLARKLSFWADQHPESLHQNDYDRFYDVVIQSYKDDFRLSGESIELALRDTGKLNLEDQKELADHFSTLYQHLCNLLEYTQSPRL